MKKQELIHTHGLIAQIQTHCEDENELNIQTPEYEELGVKPTSIHKSKTDHKEAVLTLVTEVADEVEELIESETATV